MKDTYDWDGEFTKLTTKKIEVLKFNPEIHWRTQDNDLIKYVDMDTKHLINCFRVTSIKGLYGKFINSHRSIFKELVKRNVITEEMLKEKT